MVEILSHPIFFDFPKSDNYFMWGRECPMTESTFPPAVGTFPPAVATLNSTKNIF